MPPNLPAQGHHDHQQAAKRSGHLPITVSHVAMVVRAAVVADAGGGNCTGYSTGAGQGSQRAWEWSVTWYACCNQLRQARLSHTRSSSVT
jgi:hypothetical protein